MQLFADDFNQVVPNPHRVLGYVSGSAHWMQIRIHQRQAPVFRIRDILGRIWILGSVLTITNPAPATDPGPDLAQSPSRRQKKIFPKIYANSFLKVHSDHSSKIKSHKGSESGSVQVDYGSRRPKIRWFLRIRIGNTERHSRQRGQEVFSGSLQESCTKTYDSPYDLF